MDPATTRTRLGALSPIRYRTCHTDIDEPATGTDDPIPGFSARWASLQHYLGYNTRVQPLHPATTHLECQTCGYKRKAPRQQVQRTRRSTKTPRAARLATAH